MAVALSLLQTPHSRRQETLDDEEDLTLVWLGADRGVDDDERREG
jgi:hypothetical protein